MPRRPRPGEWATLYAEIPPDLKAWLECQAKANMRSATAELITLLRSGLDPKHQPATPGRPRKAPADADGPAVGEPAQDAAGGKPKRKKRGRGGRA